MLVPRGYISSKALQIEVQNGTGWPQMRVMYTCITRFLHTACHIFRRNMAYSERAKAVRRCKATRRDGQPCRAYANWGTELCAGHTYKRRGKATEAHRYNGMRTNAPACTCVAYAWPHRPGGGRCRWPDPPIYRSTLPTGTHSYPRGYKRRYGALLRRWGVLW
jgi:hypothetical protein